VKGVVLVVVLVRFFFLSFSCASPCLFSFSYARGVCAGLAREGARRMLAPPPPFPGPLPFWRVHQGKRGLSSGRLQSPPCVLTSFSFLLLTLDSPGERCLREACVCVCVHPRAPRRLRISAFPSPLPLSPCPLQLTKKLDQPAFPSILFFHLAALCAILSFSGGACS